jgi:chloramphenicol-sensitive protein RarD
VTRTTLEAPTPATARDHHRSDALFGLLCGVGAYASWGFVAIYFKLIAHVPAIVVLGHRIAWSALLLVIVIALQRRWDELRACLRNGNTMRLLAASTIAVAINWFTYIWAVGHDQVIVASLGYFINPLISVLLGVIFLKERLRTIQGISLLIATGAVTTMVVLGGEFPTIAIVIAVSFAVYGLLRKLAVVAPMIGLLVETAILLPLALIPIGRYATTTSATVGTYGLLAMSGFITAIPLLWFAAAARRLRLSTLGFLQYLSPTGQFLLGRFLYHEPLDRTKLTCYACIWVALLIFSIDSIRAYRRPRAAALAVNPPE